MTVASLHKPLATGGQPLAPVPVRIRRRWQETADIFTLELEPPGGNFTFQPGQFNMLYAYGVGESAISLCGAPDQTDRILHTIRAVGSVTTALARLGVGDMVGVRGPFGSTWPMAELQGKDVLLISGGLGSAPLRPVACHVFAHRAQFGRCIWLHGARSPADLAFAADFAAWQQRTDAEVLLTVDRADANWTGPVGLVTSLLNYVQLAPERTVALLCGPEVMMRFTQRELAARGIPETAIFVSLERNMQCAVALCGHCQLGASFVCLNGPVYRWDQVSRWLLIPEA
jgi:NAD(P)H-flavin reductase